MVNDEVSVEDLLYGIIIASGNDACVVLAEGIAGSEEAFAEMMTEKALEISNIINKNFILFFILSSPLYLKKNRALLNPVKIIALPIR